MTKSQKAVSIVVVARIGRVNSSDEQVSVLASALLGWWQMAGFFLVDDLIWWRWQWRWQRAVWDPIVVKSRPRHFRNTLTHTFKTLENSESIQTSAWQEERDPCKSYHSHHYPSSASTHCQIMKFSIWKKTKLEPWPTSDGLHRCKEQYQDFRLGNRFENILFQCITLQDYDLCNHLPR